MRIAPMCYAPVRVQEKAMSEDERQTRRERHDTEMAERRADTAPALHEARFPAMLMAALVLALVGAPLPSLVG